MLHYDRCVHSPPCLETKFLELACKPLAVSATFDYETALLAPGTIVRKAEEPKRFAALCAALPAQFT